MKIKQSELRLYCDLLTQQTHDMKNLIISLKSTENVLKKENSLNLESMHLVSKNNSNLNDNVSTASSFKSFNDDSILNQLEQQPVNELENSNDSVKVNI